MEAFRVFIKPFEGPQRSEKKKNSAKFLSSSEIRTGRFKNVITFKSWIKKFLIRFWNRLVKCCNGIISTRSYNFTNKFRMISTKNIGWDGLITFWKKVSSFNPSLQPTTTWLLIFFGTNNHLKVGQKVISKWGSFDNLLFQSGTSAISKWSRDSYFK